MRWRRVQAMHAILGTTALGGPVPRAQMKFVGNVAADSRCLIHGVGKGSSECECEMLNTDFLIAVSSRPPRRTPYVSLIARTCL
jgi:hypothetical protein